MKNELVLVESSDLKKIQTHELLASLASLILDTARQILLIGRVIVELESRGEDLNEFRIAMIRHLRSVGLGKVLPEIVVRYSGANILLDRIAALPIHQQKRLVDEPTIELVVVTPKGSEHRKVDPLRMNYNQIVQAFASDHIRDTQEQEVYLSTPTRREAQKTPRRQLRCHADHQRGGVTVGRSFVPKAEVALALSELAGPLDVIDKATAHVMSFHATEAEKNRIKGLAKSAGLEESDLLRNALRACGMI